ncbi:MAG: MBL fold metallo-hydrolase [Patescibacteria group bacterium]|nr:MBL fold metallo-hydrolase [Patescibacteria group bacterium]MDE1946069.1 MBL fold metallo-hydrolase [Patescibacteria group bacterium]
MMITKFGHCCLLVEEKGVRIITDPGTYSTAQDDVENIDIMLVTHDHFDHFHLDSVKNILKKNPNAIVITNASVGALLVKEGIPFTKVEDGEKYEYQGVIIEGIGRDHAFIHDHYPVCQNTGYFISGKLFYPGDALTDPHRRVPVLALPVAGPWMKFSEGVSYAEALKPDVCFPVHDANSKSTATTDRLAPTFLEPKGIRFVPMPIGKATEF